MRGWVHAAGFAVALAGLIALAHGGPGWGAPSAAAASAVRLQHSATAPLYGVLAGAAALLPAGEPGFRLAILGALLGATALAGVVAAGRAILPKQPLAGWVAASVLLLAPPFRDACAEASPSILAAAGAIWAIAFALGQPAGQPATAGLHQATVRLQIGALAACGAVIGSAPYLGGALLLAIAELGRRKVSAQRIALATGIAIAVTLPLWLRSSDALPEAAPSLARLIASSGRGAGAVVIGAGWLGIAFGAITGLRGARVVALAGALAMANEILVGGGAAVVLVVLALGSAILAGAVVRAVGAGAGASANANANASANAATSENAAATAGAATLRLKPHLICLAAGIPLALACLATGAGATPSPGATPIRLADDLSGSLPSGPGVFIATRPTGYFALAYERVVAGVRPDLSLTLTADDVIAANALRDHLIVGTDVASFGRLDLTRAMPRGRGFQLLAEAPAHVPPPAPPADYATEIGADESIALAVERAGYEAASGRLDAAARAAGLTERFGAGSLAILAATRISPARPPLFGFLPEAPRGAWLLDTFGDDLAWVAGLPPPELPTDAPMPRKLHARWCALLGTNPADPSSDPQIAAMGNDAIAATVTMWRALHAAQ